MGDNFHQDLRRLENLSDFLLSTDSLFTEPELLSAAVELLVRIMPITGAVAILHAEGGRQGVLTRSRDGETSMQEVEIGSDALRAAAAASVLQPGVHIISGGAMVEVPLAQWLEEVHPGLDRGDLAHRAAYLVFGLAENAGVPQTLLICRAETVNADDELPSAKDLPFLEKTGRHISAALVNQRTCMHLEGLIGHRTRELGDSNRGMRQVLDNVAQGFITIDLDGTMRSEHSAVVDKWFGAPVPGTRFSALIEPHSPDFALWFELGLDSLRDQFLPVELLLSQMPKRFALTEQTFEVAYSPIYDDEAVVRILLIVSDVTEHMIRERAERGERELVALFQRITQDRSGFDEFVSEASDLVTSLTRPSDAMTERRVVHTLKGNCGLYGLESFAELCHTIEDELADRESEPLATDQRARLSNGWSEVVGKISRLLGDRPRSIVEVDVAELAAAVEKARQGMAGRDLAALLSTWAHESVRRRFERIAQYAKQLAPRLGKGELAVEIRDSGIRLESARFAPFWAALIHAVRNAIDHGIESTEERLSAGKPASGSLELTAMHTATGVRLAIRDDGRGIDWDAVRERAEAAGIASATRKDLEEALFADGLSTRYKVNATSGRGVGLGALREAVSQLGGVIEIESQRHVGTTMAFAFPVELIGATRALVPS
jgi:two-component system, chemotaxis family, sensor kinase CheA